MQHQHRYQHQQLSGQHCHSVCCMRMTPHCVGGMHHEDPCTPGVHKAHTTMQACLHLHATLVDLVPQVQLEHVSGAVPMSFLGSDFTNAYRSLPVVTIVITPTHARGKKGLLLSAHYDTAVASPGGHAYLWSPQ